MFKQFKIIRQIKSSASGRKFRLQAELYTPGNKSQVDLRARSIAYLRVRGSDAPK